MPFLSLCTDFSNDPRIYIYIYTHTLPFTDKR